MLKARREARQGAAEQYPRYTHAGSRSRYHDQSQGYPSEQYEYQQQKQRPHYNNLQQYGLQYGPLQLQWSQQPSQPSQVCDPRPQYLGQQQPRALPPNGSYISDKLGAQQVQAYLSPQLQALQLPPQQQPNGSRPCVIPQITHKRLSGSNMSPFLRARVPELELLHKISSHELIVFIDQLNEAFMANPALQAANTAANVGGMAPSMIVQLVSVGVNVAAGVGASVTTKMRTKKYLAKANDELFHPRGLHVHMCKTDKMLEYVGLGGQENVFVRRRYEEAFHDAQRVPIVGPMGPSPSESCSHPIMQRMSLLGDRVMVLSFDGVENATMPDGFWKKWGAKEARKAEQRQYEKMMKDQVKQDRKAGRRSGRRGSRRQERQKEKKAKEVKKIMWIVIAAYEEGAEGHHGIDDWDSESESSESHRH